MDPARAAPCASTSASTTSAPARTRRSPRCGPARARRARRHADGRRQVALLPAAGAHARRPDARRLAARLAHAGPGRGARAGGAGARGARQRPAGRGRQPRRARARRSRRAAPALRRARALLVARVPRGDPRGARSACSSSTRRTASRSGATTSARTTSAWPTPRAGSGAQAIIASTATATPQVAGDIAQRLGLRDPVRVTHRLRPAQPVASRSCRARRRPTSTGA